MTRRVLVTGFCDWKELGEPPDEWRCRDNPSGRLLTGAPTDGGPPAALAGPLVDRLCDGGGLDWSFRLLPVTWGVLERQPDLDEFDVLINLGLGVYDRDDQLQPERGAYNRRAGDDALGRRVDEPLDAGAPALLPELPDTADRLRAAEGRRFGPYAVRVADARADNVYLCNETHARALAWARRGTGRTAFFIHLPHAPDREGGMEVLAEGVAALIRAMVAGDKR